MCYSRYYCDASNYAALFLLLFLIPQCFDWLTAVHLDLLQAVIFIAVHCQLLCFWWRAVSTAVLVFPLPLFRIWFASSMMFTANSSWLIACPVHKWRLILQTFKCNLPSFALYKTSSFVILSAHFSFSILLQHHVSHAFTNFPWFFTTVRVSDP
jgi:hypothetical protein